MLRVTKPKKLAIVSALLLFVSLTLTAEAAPPTSPQIGAAYSLSLSVIPPKLPADGKTYGSIVVFLQDKSGNPSLALNDTTVFLTSSVESIGFVSPRVVIRAGHCYAIANFTTTTTPGVSVVTASAIGLQSFSTAVQTVTPSGFPTRLQVFPIPSTVLARPNSTGTLLVVTEDDTGLPARAVGDVNVTVSSSNTAVIGIPQRILTVKSGEFMALSSYTSTFITGSSFITVSASGFVSSSAIINVVGPVPLKLNMQAVPPEMVLNSYGEVVVSLTDMSGRPARAPSDIVVTLTSSNLTVASVQPSVTIGKGQIYAVAQYFTTGATGSSILTASSPGLVSSFSSVKTYNRSQPTSLAVYISPNPILADNTTYSSVVVSLLNGTGFPAVSTHDTNVTLTSSNSAVGNVNQTLIIPAGSNFAVSKFKSTYLVGNTQITASAQNLVPAQVTISTFGPIPARVYVESAPLNFPADGGTYTALSVMLLDSNGSPAVSPVDVPVQLTSSRPDVVSVNTTVIIQAGKTYALVPIKTTVSPGSSNITASASGYSPSSTVVTTVRPAPSNLALFVAPSQGIVPISGPSFFLAVQLQDASGNPARARVVTDVSVVSSNITVLGGPINVRIGIGSDFNSTNVYAEQGGSATLTASSHGLASSSVQFSLAPLPLTIQLAPTTNSPFIYPNMTVPFQLTVELEGVGVQSANVTWSSSGGAMKPSSSVTDSSGRAYSTFYPSLVGEATVSASVTSTSVGTRIVNSSILVVMPPEKARPTLLSRILPFIPLLVVAVILIMIVFAVRRIIIRRKRKAVEEEEEEAEEMREEKWERAREEGSQSGGG